MSAVWPALSGGVLLIVSLWLPMSLLAAPASDPLRLTLAQREWLAAHPHLRVGLVLQAPYAQFDRHLQQLSGVNVEVVNALVRSLPVELSWRTFTDPADLDRAVRNGEVDFAPGLSQTPAGLRHWLYSDPYMRIAQRVVGLRNEAVAVDLEALDSRDRVAVRMPSAVADYLRSTYGNLNLQGVPLERQALQLLLSQQARYAVLDEAQLSRLSREAEFAELAVVGDIGLPLLLRVATRKDWPQLAEILDVALLAVPAKEFEQLHDRWLAVHYPPLSASPGFWQNLSVLLGLLLCAGIAVALWQRRRLLALEQRLLDERAEAVAREAGEQAMRVAQFSIDQSTVGILWVNWDSHVGYANRAAEKMLGYAAGAVLGRPLVDFEPNLSMDRWLALWNAARSGETTRQRFETHCLRADGHLLPADVSLSFLRFREAEYLVVFLTDVTERHRALAALQESEARLRELAAHLESVREEEKARIAREVHDELGQILTVLKLETSMCELGFGHLDPGLNERLDSMKRLIAQLFQQVRDVATALRPPILDAGIGSAIEWQAQRFEARTQMTCLVQVPEQPLALSDAKAIGLFRVLQEALTNVLRHAQAHTVEIGLTLDASHLCLTIEDDGCGFIPADAPSNSFGLVGMRERVLMLGGSLALRSAPGEGTCLTVQVTLN
ncbi:ATP-binding protein [Pseudomonas sp. nanlin1]|uniref:sensor histidine kinase n=1 Tax=Pseudomonas sp. nanlin1 TaxID=3040605 RepID=UPI00388F17FC